MADSKRFLLRLDPDLFEALRRWADDDLRSINGQIEFLLTDQARRAGRLPAKRARPPRQIEEDMAAPESIGALGEVDEPEVPARRPRTRTSA
jgi:hypothetical protein